VAQQRAVAFARAAKGRRFHRRSPQARRRGGRYRPPNRTIVRTYVLAPPPPFFLRESLTFLLLAAVSSLIAAGATGVVSLHDLDAPETPATTTTTAAPPHRFAASTVCFRPVGGDVFLSGSFDRTVRVWDTRSLSVAHTFPLSGAVHHVAMAPRAHHSLAAVAYAAPGIRLLDLASGAGVQELLGHSGTACHAVAWNGRDENLVASGGEDGQVRVWDVRMSCMVSLDRNAGCEGRGRVDRRNRAHDGSFVVG